MIKKSIENKILKYHQKQLGQHSTSRTPRAKNKKPEKDTQKQVMAWAKEMGLFLHVVDSSSYDPILRRKGTSRAAVGFPDIVGNTALGHSVYIELKAKDRRSTLSEAQRLFLENKIQQNCFAVVVDSAARLAQYWKGYNSLKSDQDRQQYLADCLPSQKQRRGHNSELGF